MARTKQRKGRKTKTGKARPRAKATSFDLDRFFAGGWSRFGLGIAFGIALGFAAAMFAGVLQGPSPGGDVLESKVDVTPDGIDQQAQKEAAPSYPSVKEVSPAQKAAPSSAASDLPPKLVPLEQAKEVPEIPVAAAPAAGKDANAGSASKPTSRIALDSQPLWLRNAVASAPTGNKPVIAIVLDDVGVAKSHAELAIDLPPEVTLAFMSYADNVADMAKRARGRGHELMLHMPMEPLDREADPGPNALRTSLGTAENLRRLRWGLDRFDGYIGVNNHMGSRFTQDRKAMEPILRELQARGLLFLDSRTIGSSVGDPIAIELGMPHVSRDVFLDNEISVGDVMRQLAEAERIAKLKGDAIAIGHPHPQTISALLKWIPDVQARGFAIVPLSAVAKRRLGADG